MTWHAALADPVFRLYVILIASLLTLSGLLLATFTYLLHKNLSKICTIWRSWLIMAPLGLLVVALGREMTIAGVTLLALLGFKELARATGLHRDRLMTFAV